MLGAVSLAFTGCHRQVRPAREGLAGLTVPLVSAPGVRLQVTGRAAEMPALITFDVAAPLTMVSRGCFSSDPDSTGAALWSAPHRGPQPVSIVEAPEVLIADRALHLTRVALSDEKTCTVAVGADVLLAHSLTIDPFSRTVHFDTSRPLTEWQTRAHAQPEGELVTLQRDPKFDWPLLPVRLTQGAHALTVTLALKTDEPFTVVSAAAVKASELTELPGEVVLVSGLELTPGRPMQVTAVKTSTSVDAPGLAGDLGADVWSHTVTSLDLAAGVLWLQHSQVTADGRCGAAGHESGEACFSLQQQRFSEGLQVTLGVRRPIREQLRVWLELEGPEAAMCRVSIAFAPQPAGASASHVLPWPRLTKSLPVCHAALAHLQSVRLGLMEEGAAATCPGTCAEVHDLSTGRVSCECQPGPAGLSAEQLEVLVHLPSHGAPVDAEPEEPKDP